jgi:hypothetical protein
MIVNKDLNSGDPTLKKWMTAIRYLHMAKRSAPSSATNPPPLPTDSLQWTQLAPTFDPRTVRHLNRIMGNFYITTLREQAYLLFQILERKLKVSITGAELSTVLREGDRGRMESSPSICMRSTLLILFLQDAPNWSTIPWKMTSCDSVFDDNKKDSRLCFLT